jgi:hypothetical protein
MEMGIKVIAVGFLFCGGQSYIRNVWNIIDFTIILVSIMDLTLNDFDSMVIVKSFRLFKGLKPLRLISKNQGLKVAVHALVKAIPNIINVLIISFLFFLIFGIIGVSLFKGTYYHCILPLPEELLLTLDLVDTRLDCLNSGGEWAPYMYPFDNIFDSMTALFHVSTTVGWAEVMYTGTSVRGVDF